MYERPITRGLRLHRGNRRARWVHADPPLARVPPRRHRLQRLHAAARARLDAGGTRRDGVQPGAATRGIRPGRSPRRPPRRRRPAAGLRAGPVRGLQGQAGGGLHAHGARRVGAGERTGPRRAPPGRHRLLQPRAVGRTRWCGDRCEVRGEGPRLGAGIRDAGQSGARGMGARQPARELPLSTSDPLTSGASWRTCAVMSIGFTRSHPGSTSTTGCRRSGRWPSPPSWPRRAATRRTPAMPRSGCPTRAMPGAWSGSWPATARLSSTSAS